MQALIKVDLIIFSTAGLISVHPTNAEVYMSENWLIQAALAHCKHSIIVTDKHLLVVQANLAAQALLQDLELIDEEEEGKDQTLGSLCEDPALEEAILQSVNAQEFNWQLGQKAITVSCTPLRDEFDVVCGYVINLSKAKLAVDLSKKDNTAGKHFSAKMAQRRTTPFDADYRQVQMSICSALIDLQQRLDGVSQTGLSTQIRNQFEHELKDTFQALQSNIFMLDDRLQETAPSSLVQPVIQRAVALAKRQHTILSSVSAALNNISYESEKTHNDAKALRDISAQAKLLAILTCVDAVKAGNSGRQLATSSTNIMPMSEQGLDVSSEIIENNKINESTIQAGHQEIRVALKKTTKIVALLDDLAQSYRA